MISWIQRNFQHHFRLVFGLILAITIVSFIVSYGPSGGLGRGQKVVVRDFFGHKLDGAAPAAADFSDARISITLQLGGPGGINADQMATYALQRVAALHIADQFRLPAPSPAELTEFIRNLRLFMGTSGQFDADRYAQFRASLRNNAGLTEGDVLRIINEDARIAKVQGLLSGPGYVLPSDVREQLDRSDTSWKVGTAVVDYASFNPRIVPTDSEIERFFQQNSFRYDVPPTVSASYVEFPAMAYYGSVTVTDAEVRAYYDANRDRFPAPDAPAKDKAAKSGFDAVRPRVEATLKLERARNLATQAASDTAYSLYDGKVRPGAPLEAALAARKLRIRNLAPFSHDAGPAELGGSAEIADAAFKLDAERYFSEAVPTATGAVILFWRDARPAHTPLLAEVRAKVAADAVENERREQFVALGRTLHDAIAASLARGVSFEKAAAAAAAAASVRIEAKVLPAFTLETAPKDLSETVVGALPRLSKGQLSDMAITADKGYLVYVEDRKLPVLAESSPRFAEVRSQLAYNSARSGAESTLAQIVDQELKRSEPVLK